MIPGKPETLRVSGEALLVRDRELCATMAVHGKVPALALVVSVDQVFVHCAKCMIRSHLWEREHWPSLEGLPTQARFLVDHARLADPLEAIQASIDEAAKNRLY